LKALSFRSRKNNFRESAFLPALALTRHYTVRRLESHRVSGSTSSAPERTGTLLERHERKATGGQNVS
jgi:hypothetical protein